MDSVAQEIIDSSPEGILDDSAELALRWQYDELFMSRPSYPVYQHYMIFHPNLFLVQMLPPKSANKCYWGYAWIPAPVPAADMDTTALGRWVNYDKGDSTNFTIYKRHLPGKWYLYRECPEQEAVNEKDVQIKALGMPEHLK